MPSALETLCQTIPVEYAEDGAGYLIQQLGPDPSGVELDGRTAYVLRCVAYYEGEPSQLVVRTADHGAELFEGGEEGLRARATALYLHIGHQALEQLVAFDARTVVTRYAPGEGLGALKLEQVEGITTLQLEQLADAIIEACTQPFELDADGVNNVLYV